MHQNHKTDNVSDDSRIRACKIFAAIFSQKPSVALKRLIILDSLNKTVNGRLKFKDILVEVKSISNDEDYNSQRLTYDLRVLKESNLVESSESGDYIITDYGRLLLDVFNEIKSKISDASIFKGPCVVGVTSGSIETDDFDHKLLVQELDRLPCFKRKISLEKDKSCLVWQSQEYFKSEIEIASDGSFVVHVAIDIDDHEITEETFWENGEKNEKIYEIARGIVLTTVFFIEKTARKLWRKSRIIVPIKPDSYPVFGYKRDFTDE